MFWPIKLPQKLERLLEEPPPEFVFEFTERGLASVQPRNPASLKIYDMGEAAIEPSPATGNMLRPDLLQTALQQRKGSDTTPKIRTALIVPDYATRMSILTFDELPPDEEQRLALIRFRLRRTLPFPIEEAQISYEVQGKDKEGKIEVLTAAIYRAVLAEYEGLLTGGGFQPGLVLPSSVAALSLCPASTGELTLLARLNGRILSILILENSAVKVVRCIDLSGEEAGAGTAREAILTLLHQTLAFAEDEFGKPVKRILLNGFESDTDSLGASLESEFGIPCATLRSRFGYAAPQSTGLLGLLERFAA